MKRLTLILIASLVMLAPFTQSYAAEAKVFFKNLKDAQTVTSPIKIEMGVEGMVVEKAGEVKAGSGHHHIIVDGKFTPEGEVVPADDTHIHFGAGQTETSLNLTPGDHTLTLQFANGIHQSYGEKLSSTIHIHVKN